MPKAVTTQDRAQRLRLRPGRKVQKCPSCHKRAASASRCASSSLSSLSKLRQARLQRTEQRLASTVRHDRPALARWLRQKETTREHAECAGGQLSNLTEPGDRPPSTVSGKRPTVAALPALARAPRLARSAADTCEQRKSSTLPERHRGGAQLPLSARHIGAGGTFLSSVPDRASARYRRGRCVTRAPHPSSRGRL